ncbi:hypothetical protein [Sporosarcina globispora]|uniref:hypothetical protein n=1 Tax=Sporosarcina globispora TaxID=1459 RepID=UPI000AA70529|nr:hypothetical protein [Sporosarcina globispora]
MSKQMIGIFYGVVKKKTEEKEVIEALKKMQTDWSAPFLSPMTDNRRVMICMGPNRF